MVEHFDTFWANAETAEIYEGGRLNNITLIESEVNVNCVYYPECRGSGAGQGANNAGAW